MGNNSEVDLSNSSVSLISITPRGGFEKVKEAETKVSIWKFKKSNENFHSI